MCFCILFVCLIIDHFGSCLLYDDKMIYIIGGAYRHKAHGSKTISVVFRYDTENDKWHSLNDLIQHRSGFGCAFDYNRDNMYLFGGITSNGPGYKVLTSIEKYSFENEKWTILPAKLQPGRVHSKCITATEFDNIIYCIGGTTFPPLLMKRLRSVSVFDTNTHEIVTNESDMLEHVSRFGVAYRYNKESLKTSIYIIGGETANHQSTKNIQLSVMDAMPSLNPSVSPSYYPTTQPTHGTIETLTPTTFPIQKPSIDPTIEPTISPSITPTIIPSADPTIEPTLNPSSLPSTFPSTFPSTIPSNFPTGTPSTNHISSTIVNADKSLTPTFNPSANPTFFPTISPTLPPSNSPITLSPSSNPTINQTPPTKISNIVYIPASTNPSSSPTGKPTNTEYRTTLLPTPEPTHPTYEPTPLPSPEPTHPTYEPTPEPTNAPTKLGIPTLNPSPEPTHPTYEPTPEPTKEPTKFPIPTPNPSPEPTHPSYEPTPEPTHEPSSSYIPTLKPKMTISVEPTHPTYEPTPIPSKEPTPISHNNKLECPINTYSIGNNFNTPSIIFGTPSYPEGYITGILFHRIKGFRTAFNSPNAIPNYWGSGENNYFSISIYNTNNEIIYPIPYVTDNVIECNKNDPYSDAFYCFNNNNHVNDTFLILSSPNKEVKSGDKWFINYSDTLSRNNNNDYTICVEMRLIYSVFK